MTDTKITVIKHKNGDKYHYCDGHLQKIEYGNGDYVVRKNGMYYRQDGSLVVCSPNTVYWYSKTSELLNREDGPAIEYGDGYKEWYLDGIKYSESAHKIEMLRRITI